MMYGQMPQALLDVVQYAQPQGDGFSYNGLSLAKEGVELQDASITVKELLPIVLACAVWGPIWCCSLMVHCDNATAIMVINSGYSRVPQIMLRCLFFIRVRFQMSLHAVHTPGHLNSVADALSHNNLSHLFKQVPTASYTPDRILPELLDLLINQQLDWTSKDLDKTVQQLFQQSGTINLLLLPIWISSVPTNFAMYTTL